MQDPEDGKARETSQPTSELQAVVQAYDDLYLRLDSTGTILGCQIAPAEDPCMPLTQLLGHRMVDLMPADLGSCLDDGLARALETMRPVVRDCRLPSVGGERSYEARLVPLAGGQVIALIRDTTPQQRSQEALRFLAEASRVLAASLSYSTTLQRIAHLVVPALGDLCLVQVMDEHLGPQSAAVHVDPGQEELLCETLRRYGFGRRDLELMQGHHACDQARIVPDVDDGLLSAYGRNTAHLEMLRDLGLEAAMIVPLVARGQTFGLIAMATTCGRHYEAADLALAEELGRRAALALDNARLYREAQEAVAARDEFLSVAAHELKTPLTSLRGYAQYVLRQLDRGDGMARDRLAEVLQTIDRQGDRLARLVQQLLDISAIQGGQLELSRRMTDVASLVAEVAAQAQFSTTRHTLIVRAPTESQALVDPLRIAEVATNLIDNAVKFSLEGGFIEIDVGIDDSVVRFAVRDHGIGIPPEHRQRIFDRFYKAHSGNHFGGLGLGLYVSRRIVDLHGGHIDVEFPADGGTRFVVVLPSGH